MIASRVARSGAALDRRAAEALLSELRPLVVRTVRLVVGAGSVVAEDATQEALLEMSRALPRLGDVGAAPAWAARIAARVALRTAKRERRLALTGLRAVEVPESIPAECPPDILELKEAFDQLSPKAACDRGAAALRRLERGRDSSGPRVLDRHRQEPAPRGASAAHPAARR